MSLLSNFILVGDFNVNLCNPHCPLLLKLQSFASSLYLTQVVSEPTRCSSSSNSLIDLVYIYRLPQISSVVQPSLHWPIQIIWAFMFPLQQVLPRAIQRELDVPSGDIHSLILKELVSALARLIGTRCLLQETSISAGPIGKLDFWK